MSDIPGIYHKSVQTAPITWIGKPIHVVSLGCGSNLARPARRAIAEAELVLGSARQLAEVGNIETRADQQTFPSPFSQLANILANNQDKSLVVLASGDALFYGVGSWLDRVIGRDHLIFHPNISSVQSCFHAIGQPWQGAETVSVHGRNLDTLKRHLHNHALLALLTDAKSHPAAIAQKLVDLGIGTSTVWVCEAMGTEAQTVTEFVADALALETQTFNPLNVCIVRVLGEPRELPAFPGIPDHWFITKSEPGYGMISKREIRLAILSLMQPSPEEIAWDLGAGCGSVSVEWARWNNHGRVYAVESDSARAECIRLNSRKFGTDLNLNVIEGTAPECCCKLPQPNSIFIGGSGDLGEMLHFGWETLPAGGKLVASAVTAKSQRDLKDFLKDKPAREWMQIGVEKNLPNQPETRTLAPVHLGKCVKPGART